MSGDKSVELNQSEVKKSLRVKSSLRETIESVLVAVLIALFLRSFVVEAFKIPSGSMIPTLAIGDQIFVNKYRYGVRVPFTSIRLVEFKQPERGEVIVFICPVPPHQDYIKRVIGLPGDKVEIKRNVIYINGQPIDRKFVGVREYWDKSQDSNHWYTFNAEAYEETIDGKTFTVLQDLGSSAMPSDFEPRVIKEGHVFVMGDNRDHSYDSRSWGLVPIDSILGRSLFVWFSWGQNGPNFKRVGTWID